MPCNTDRLSDGQWRKKKFVKDGQHIYKELALSLEKERVDSEYHRRRKRRGGGQGGPGPPTI